MWERRYFRIAKQATHKLICAKCGRYIKFANKNEKKYYKEIHLMKTQNNKISRRNKQ